MKTPARNAGVFLSGIGKSESDIGSGFSTMASLNAVVSAVNVRDKGISGGTNLTAVSSDIFISVSASCSRKLPR